MTAPEFEKARKDTGVCVLSIGCIEKHFDHLPLGTDFLNGHAICCMAAEKEPAVVFPPYYFGQINEARCFPGTVALGPVLLMQLLSAVCGEISRNGFGKIIFYSAHGGNHDMLPFFCQTMLSDRNDYVVYVPGGPPVLWPEGRRKEWEAVRETPRHGHACECETSISLANHPELVKMDAVDGRTADPLGRLDHIPLGTVTGRWYADHPDHYAGDASAATAEKGVKLRQLEVDSLAEYIAAVKNDQVAPALLKEFYDRCDEIR